MSDRREFIRTVIAGGTVTALAGVGAIQILAQDSAPASQPSEFLHALDPENMSEGEQKHVPLIDLPDGLNSDGHTTVRVRVGEVPHVMEDTHWIMWVELHCDGEMLAHIDLDWRVPEATLAIPTRLQGGETLIARESCNIHGDWESEPFAVS
jgi:superoxide reductase